MPEPLKAEILQDFSFNTDSNFNIVSSTTSADGAFWATIDDKIVRVESRESNGQVVLSGHNDSVTSVRFSPDGTHVVTTSADRTARIWNSQTGELVYTLTGHRDWVRDVSFSPDGAHIVTASDDRTARIWDSKSGEMVHVLDGHWDWGNFARFNPDGSQIVTTGADGIARIWDARSGSLLQEIIIYTQSELHYYGR